jgi:hypothetical protein
MLLAGQCQRLDFFSSREIALAYLMCDYSRSARRILSNMARSAVFGVSHKVAWDRTNASRDPGSGRRHHLNVDRS